MDGGEGDDTVCIYGASVDFALSNDPTVPGATDVTFALAGSGAAELVTVLTRVEHLEFNDRTIDLASHVIRGTDAPETLTGDDNGDQIDGLGGNDHLIGGTGNDTLDGGSGDDTLADGQGNDVYYIDSSGDGVSETSGEGADTVNTSANWNVTPGSEIEKLVGTGTVGLFLAGNAHAMEIDGTVETDRLDDGSAADTLAGGAGNDSYLVHNAGTSVVELAGGGYDNVRTDLSSYTLPANVEALTYIGVGDFSGTGNAQANLIVGGGGNDTLDGGANSDGRGDRLVGGLGDDVYYTHSALDFVAENPTGGYDTVHTTANAAVANPNVEALSFIGAGNFVGFAAAQGTAVTGGAGNDKLYGGAGTDTLDGGPGGNDLLKGGAGADTFVLTADSPGVTHIFDFTVGVDHLQIKTDPTDDITEFLTPQDNFDPSDEGHGLQYRLFFYDQASGKLYDEGQNFVVSGGQTYGGTGHLIATFDGHPNLTASDLVFG